MFRYMDLVKDVVISKATNLLSLPKNNQKIFSIFVHNYTFIKFDTSNLLISFLALPVKRIINI